MNIQRLRDAVQWAIFDSKTQDLPLRWEQGSWGQALLSTIEENSMPAEKAEDGGMYVPVTCATSCCIAGNIVLMNGDKFAVSVDDFGTDLVHVKAQAQVDEEPEEVSTCVSKEGVAYNIENRAADLLGINQWEANILFNGSNSIEEVCFIALAIAHHYGEDLGLPEAETLAENHSANSANYDSPAHFAQVQFS